MRLFLDQDVYGGTRRFLLDEGHDVATAAEVGMSRSPDIALMRFARENDRILVTRDRDFGRLALADEPTPGIFYLRMRPSTLLTVHRELKRVLELYDEPQLVRSFVVIEAGRHRIRRRLS